MSAEAPVSERDAVLLLVACESCGHGAPMTAGRSIRGPRLRCAAWQIALIEAMEDLVIRRVSGQPLTADEMSRAVACFECKMPADDEQAGFTRLFVCSHCGSRSFMRQLPTG